MVSINFEEYKQFYTKLKKKHFCIESVICYKIQPQAWAYNSIVMFELMNIIFLLNYANIKSNIIYFVSISYQNKQ